MTVCPADSLVPLAPGTWHLTGAVNGRCAITNIYSERNSPGQPSLAQVR